MRGGPITINEVLHYNERSSKQIRTSKDYKIMLLVPIVPHSDSGNEDDILTLVCPSETDLIIGSVSEKEYNQIPEEVRFISDGDDYDHRSDEDYDERRSGIDSEMICDTFFADIREMEERNEMKSATTRLRIIEEEARTDSSCSYQEPEPTTRNLNPVSRSLQATERMYLKTKNQPSKSFEEGLRNTFKTGRQVPVYTIQHSHSNESNDSDSSSWFSNISGVSYSSASIMRLKARKRMLEKHHSRSNILKGTTVSLNQVDVSRKNNCAIVAAV